MRNPDDEAEEHPTRAGGVPVYVVNKKARPASLRLIKGPGAPSTVTLDLAEMVVGRSQDAHLTLDSDSISRRHAVFRQIEGGFVCEDLGSSNGVFVNGTKAQSATLRDGDTVQIGEALLVYEASR